MINVGLIGYGYWGPNLARNFQKNRDMNLKTICDSSPDRLKAAGDLYPGVGLLNSVEDLINDKDIDAIAIATPVSAHFDLAKKILISGKHVWIEKPMTETSEQAMELIDLAEKNKKVIIVDHTFIYTGAVRKIKEVINSILSRAGMPTPT